ncbi:MATE efflux family protein [Anaerocolumna cellulosilytica]|uniref:Probable multidrug resistance protein NorM n=1 Tax=Anaerocolumna cellulosilytica TaxID=433286 RepID=A0A6S6R161_9FIRM|nr:MATE family efflux transporter [Anaerocolumna cellulosilytica]MBB5194381.1 putative MATE family efflux protein [Anaerocolumna cellulosilytica]BCJ93325.1 MATE efflux family protein [Anaerocolumna cellulosilytica]
MNVVQKTKHFFSVKGMIKPQLVTGELPPTKEVYQDFLKVAWPSALESLLVGLVGSVDTIMVGSLGKGAITAVGITNQPKFILLAMIFSLNIGITAVVARRKGQNDREGANRSLRAGILLSFIIALTMAILGSIFAAPILRFSGAESSYFQDAVSYFRVLMVSIFFTSLNLTINAAQRGSGNTKISMRTNIVSNLVNVVFNYFLINGIGFFPKLGVTGAAIATCLGSIAACIISIATLLRKDSFLSLRVKGSWRLTKEVLTPITKVGSSAFIEQVFMRIGFLVYAILVAKLGTTAYATHLICMNILNLSFCFGDGFSIAASSLVGQSLGRKRPDMAIIYGKAGQRLAFMVSTLLFIFFIGTGKYLITLFNSEPEVVLLGSGIMIIIAFTTHAQTSQVIMSGCLRGAGDTIFVAIVSMISVTLIRPFLTWLLCFPVDMGLYGAWIALCGDQILRLVLNFIRFSNGKWTKITL